MAIATNCLSSQQIQALLNASGSELELSQFTEHVGTCSSCQQALQVAATGEIEVEALVAHGASSPPPKDSAYWPTVGAFLRRPEESASESTSTTTSSITASQLSFLQASEDPAYIGKLDHFEISRIIGRGGMGIVLEGFDTHLQRPVGNQSVES